MARKSAVSSQVVSLRPARRKKARRVLSGPPFDTLRVNGEGVLPKGGGSSVHGEPVEPWAPSGPPFDTLRVNGEGVLPKGAGRSVHGEPVEPWAPSGPPFDSALGERGAFNFAQDERVVFGILNKVEGTGLASVLIRGVSSQARTTVPLRPEHEGAQITLLVSADPSQAPVILGVVLPIEEKRSRPTHARVDGKRVTLEAKTELVLRCGQASLTLSRDGKVVLKGAELLQTASGTHRIQGAAVRIN